MGPDQQLAETGRARRLIDAEQEPVEPLPTEPSAEWLKEFIQAATLLLHSDQPVTCIGHAVGWPDQNYFARRFKAHYGLSATTYRARFATGAIHLAPVPAGWTTRAAEAG